MADVKSLKRGGYITLIFAVAGVTKPFLSAWWIQGAAAREQTLRRAGLEAVESREGGVLPAQQQIPPSLGLQEFVTAS